MNCKTKEHKLIKLADMHKNASPVLREIKILLAFSGLKQALTMNPGYNCRVDECREAAALLLKAVGDHKLEPVLSNDEALLCNVPREAYDAQKRTLEPDLAKRAEHFFLITRVLKGWTN